MVDSSAAKTAVNLVATKAVHLADVKVARSAVESAAWTADRLVAYLVAPLGRLLVASKAVTTADLSVG